MKLTLFALLLGVSAAVEYSALQDVITKAPIRTIRLTELQAKVDSQGPMDQVGSLVYQQMREISQEITDLDAGHNSFQRGCSQTAATLRSDINRLTKEVAVADAAGSNYAVQWNRMRIPLPGLKTQREDLLKQVKALKAKRVKEIATRAATKATYDADMADFGAALKDLDDIKKIIVNSKNFDSTTGANTAQQGFLEAVDNVSSDKLKYQTNRLTRAAKFLEADDSTDSTAPSGVDKLLNLIYGVRNEMWAEMDKLSKIEGESIRLHKLWLIRTNNEIGRLEQLRATIFINIGVILTNIGNKMLLEADQRMASAKGTKELDRKQIELDFLEDDCSAEPPMYKKSRATKMSEIETLELMLSILRNLNWSGAVYNAIARISAGGVDENPEPGYTIGYQMDIGSGLKTNNYVYQGRAIKNVGRVAVHLQIGSQWVWASFDAFTQDVKRYLIPTISNAVVEQRRVKNLNVFKSASANVESSKNTAEGNIESWATNYGKNNKVKVPHASDGTYDFGDDRHASGSYGCFQVHDYLQKQTILAVNHLVEKNRNHDVGIGNQPITKVGQNPDWTFSGSATAHVKARNRMTITWYFQNKGYGTSGAKVTTKPPTTKPPTVKAATTKSPVTAGRR